MKANDIRSEFYNFFKSKDHTFVKSSPLIPINDSSLLFINAGMNQFKNIFLDKEKPLNNRVYNSQKCIRVSGKHNDLEEVGVDSFHHTFFEMLGNWSFGDYYKKEAIVWAWQLFTDVFNLDKNRLWVTVYDEDDESANIWRNYTNIDSSRILKSGKKDNFWEMGDTGPCGPCSEIHYYIGDDLQKQSSLGVNNSPEYWELWNLVFIQFNRLENGTLQNLSKKYVDTGAGLERLTAVLQNKKSNYDTDLFKLIIKTQENIFKNKYNDNLIAHRAISDHIRMLVFSISDGVVPSNEGRGYVSRRILRRAVRFGYNMGAKQPFMSNLVDPVINIMELEYPELKDKKIYIKKVLDVEEKSFIKTLDRGIKRFNKIIKSNKSISGVDAFNLYDTFGFPIDLTLQMSKEKNIDININDFKNLMNNQKAQSRRKKQFLDEKIDDLKWEKLNNGKSKFFGYENDKSISKILKYYISNDKIFFELSKTPFYAEMGGQVGDIGYIKNEKNKIEVIDTIYKSGKHLQVSKINKNFIIDEKEFKCEVNISRRKKIKNNHTSTHLLHQALIDVLGDHVHQAGSLVHPEYLRFDFTHFNKINESELFEIEKIVNEMISSNIYVKTDIQKYDIAKKNGAKAMFDEKYGDLVRVVAISDYSVELCGGTHVEKTGDIGLFLIKQEGSLSSGVRRIIAVTNSKALNLIHENKKIINSMKSILKTSINDIPREVKKLYQDKINLNKKLKMNSSKSINIDNLINKKNQIDSHSFINAQVDLENIDELKSIVNKLLNRSENTVVIIYSKTNKPILVVGITNDFTNKNLDASKLSKFLGNLMGGGGGGRKNIATAGAKNLNSFNDVVSNLNFILKNYLNDLN